MMVVGELLFFQVDLVVACWLLCCVKLAKGSAFIPSPHTPWEIPLGFWAGNVWVIGLHNS